MLKKTPIIPIQQTFAKGSGSHDLHLEAICVFAAIGFFLDEDTFWKDQVVLSPASNHTLDADGKLINSDFYFKWHYTPRDISFNEALEEFTSLFETIIAEQTDGKKVILPLSGGIDSRTQAVALRRKKAKVSSYSYEFKNGYSETKIARQIANRCNFEFNNFTIPKGYLWDVIESLADLNKCYSDFTHPRQMAIYDKFDPMGDVFSLGHWGDVLFDNMHLPNLTEEEEVNVLIKKILQKGGMAFGSQLWQVWELSGKFEDYLRVRVLALLQNISINDTNARLRAFKSMYWAPRWTSVNLCVFKSKHPITTPYYDNRMCQFICTIPESYLKGRQLQLAYIKAKAPDLATITWQDQRPFNITNYHLNRTPYNLPYRVTNKIKRSLKTIIGNPYVQRNWELQFLGRLNKQKLEQYLFDDNFNRWIPKETVQHQYNSFCNGNAVWHAHAVSMLLTLSVFNSMQKR